LTMAEGTEKKVPLRCVCRDLSGGCDFVRPEPKRWGKGEGRILMIIVWRKKENECPPCRGPALNRKMNGGKLLTNRRHLSSRKPLGRELNDLGNQNMQKNGALGHKHPTKKNKQLEGCERAGVGGGEKCGTWSSCYIRKEKSGKSPYAGGRGWSQKGKNDLPWTRSTGNAEGTS